MNDPFTVNPANFTQIEKLEEIRRAYSERCKFSGQFGWQKFIWNSDFVNHDGRIGVYEWVQGDGSPADALKNNHPAHGKGINAQNWAFWGRIQYFFSGGGYGWFVDDYQGLQPSFMQFCQRAGGALYASPSDYGFRRAVSVDADGNPIFERGFAIPGDILGYWIIEDLLSAFSVPLVYGLTVSNSPHVFNINTKSWIGYAVLYSSTAEATFDAAYADTISKPQPDSNTSTPSVLSIDAGILQADSTMYMPPGDADPGLWWHYTDLMVSSRSMSVETAVPADLAGYYIKTAGLVRHIADSGGIFTTADIDLPLSAGWQDLPSSYSAENSDPPPNRGPANEGSDSAMFSVGDFRLFFNFTNL